MVQNITSVMKYKANSIPDIGARKYGKIWADDTPFYKIDPLQLDLSGAAEKFLIMDSGNDMLRPFNNELYSKLIK